MTPFYLPIFTSPRKMLLVMGLLVGILTYATASPTLAHESGGEYDRFENAVQCAGMWLGDTATTAVQAIGAQGGADGMSYDTGMTFRLVALEAKPEADAEVEYLISIWVQYFSRLANDGSGQFPASTGSDRMQWADEQLLRHQRFCQGFGLSLADKWGFH